MHVKTHINTVVHAWTAMPVRGSGQSWVKINSYQLLRARVSQHAKKRELVG